MGMQLLLKNWMCHENVELEFESPVNLVVSQNMAGKTALRDAVEFAIAGTGLLRGISTKKDLALLSIRDDEPECSVELICEVPAERRHTLKFLKDKFGVERTMNRAGVQKLRVLRGDGTVETKSLGDAQKMIWSALGLEWEQLRSALAAEALFVLPYAERRNLISSLAGDQGIDRNELVDLMMRRSIDQPDAEEFATFVQTTGWRPAQQTAERRRADEKARIKGLGEKAAPDPMFRPPWRKEPLDLRSFGVEDVEGRLKVLRDSLASQQVDTAHDRGAIEGRLKGLEEEQENVRREVEQLEEQGPVDVGEREKRVRLDQNTVDLAQQAQREAVDEINALEKEAGVAHHLDQLTRPDPCPVIPGGPKCPMTPAKLKAHEAALKDRDELIGHKLSAARDRVSSANERLKVDEAMLQDSRDKLAAETSRRDALTSRATRLDSIEDAIERASAELADIPDEPAPDDGLFTRERVSQGEKTLAAKRAFDQAHEQAASYDSKKTRYEADRDRWDRVAQALKPEEVEAVFTERTLGPVRESLEKFGKKFGGIRLTSECSVELYWEGRWRRWQQLSESGRLRIGYAVQYAFARACGFPLLVIDQIDHLDREGKWALLETLRDVSPEFASVLGLATLQRKSTTPAPFQSVATYVLTGGVVARVK